MCAVGPARATGREILILQRRDMRTLCAKLTVIGLVSYNECEAAGNDIFDSCRLDP